MVSNVPKDHVQAALSAAHVEQGMFYNPYNPVIVNTGSKLILIDTGTGEASNAQSKGAIGQFLTNAAAAGFKPEDFDAVVAALPANFDGDLMIEVDEPSVESRYESHRMAFDWAQQALRSLTSSGA